jgi:predicted DNA-binding transcriptional regulator AlpA
VSASGTASGALMLRVCDLASEFRVSRSTVYRMIATGKLPPRREVPGLSRPRWLRRDVDEWTLALPMEVPPSAVDLQLWAESMLRTR